jgi:hypothetical protein
MEGNEDIFEIMNDAAFRGLASEQLVREGYDQLRNRESRGREGPEGPRGSTVLQLYDKVINKLDER